MNAMKTRMAGVQVVVLLLMAACGQQTIDIGIGQTKELQDRRLTINWENTGAQITGIYTTQVSDYEEQLIQTLIRSAYMLKKNAAVVTKLDGPSFFIVRLVRITPATGRQSGKEYDPNITFTLTVSTQGATKGTHQLRFFVGLEPEFLAYMHKILNEQAVGGEVKLIEQAFDKERIGKLAAFLRGNTSGGFADLKPFASYILTVRVV